MIERTQYEDALKIVMEYERQLYESLRTRPRFRCVTLDTLLEDSGISVRLSNVLKKHYRGNFAQIKLHELQEESRNQIIKITGMGDATIKELDELLEFAGIQMKP